METFEQNETELLCILIPIAGKTLLLPNVTVAEIVPYRRLETDASLPPWCAGTLPWRGTQVPVIRFEVVNGHESEPHDTGRCVLILNRVQRRDGRPFYGLVAEALPRLVHLAAVDVEERQAPLGPAERVAVLVGMEMAIVPDLAVLEATIEQLDAPMAPGSGNVGG
jgi:chemosensory pili system protein ChpC